MRDTWSVQRPKTSMREECVRALPAWIHLFWKL